MGNKKFDAGLKNMLFSSMTFIFIFLPIVCITYLLARNDIRNFLLLTASIIFYAWGEPNYLVIMLSTILINYWGATSAKNYKGWIKDLVECHKNILL